ncbi:MAG: Rne/Rng family ribonuclease [Deltaproteobacteria bacterium]|nr:Rne/Rng family ribonuclease [Deltaproteobacteria bacterium]
MKHSMLINAVHREQKRMATVTNGKLLEYNIQMSFKEPITGNIYKGIVQKVERGLQAAFVNYGGKKDGFLPLRDAGFGHATEQSGGPAGGKQSLKVGQEILVQIVREVSERKGALLTGYISLPGRYLVLLPNKNSSGISRKIEDEEDRKRLRALVEQIKIDDDIGFIVRTAGMNRTKQELSRDYQLLSRLWKEIRKRAEDVSAPALIYQESDFGVCSLRDYFTSEIEEILVDDTETFKKVRAYCKAVAPRNVKMIKLYKEKTPIFDKYQLEDQIRAIYRERVELKSGGYVIINPTEAMITIDVNSGRASNKRNVEETAFKTNLEAAEEIARQLRLRDLGGLIVIDFIDMEDRKHEAEVEKTFKKAMSVDRARVQLSRISKFGILELSRQKKHSTIQEISYTTCPFCKGTGHRPSLEYTSLGAFRKVESQAVKGHYSHFKITVPYEVADYLLNQKRTEIAKLESTYDVSINISGSASMAWDDLKIETAERKAAPEQEAPVAAVGKEKTEEGTSEAPTGVIAAGDTEEGAPGADSAVRTEGKTGPERKRSRRRPRHRRRKNIETPPVVEAAAVAAPESPAETAEPTGEQEAADTMAYLPIIVTTDD